MKANNGVNPAASQPFTLTVRQPPKITSLASATFTVGTRHLHGNHDRLPNAGAHGNRDSAIRRHQFVDNGNGTATLSGTPAAGPGGSYPITVKANNEVNPAASQPFTIVVKP